MWFIWLCPSLYIACIKNSNYILEKEEEEETGVQSRETLSTVPRH